MPPWSRFILLLQLMTTKELESATRLPSRKASQYHWFLVGFICGSPHQCVEAKNIDDVFQTSSRVFRLFSFFALHRFHYEVVVHPVMALGLHIVIVSFWGSLTFIDSLEASTWASQDCHKMDDQGQPVTLMGAVTYKSLLGLVSSGGLVGCGSSG